MVKLKSLSTTILGLAVSSSAFADYPQGVITTDEWRRLDEHFNRGFDICFSDVEVGVGKTKIHNGRAYKDYAHGNLWITDRISATGLIVGMLDEDPCESNVLERCQSKRIVSQDHTLKYGFTANTTAKRKTKFLGGSSVDTLWSNHRVDGWVSSRLEINSNVGYAAYFHVKFSRGHNDRPNRFIKGYLTPQLRSHIKKCAKKAFSFAGVNNVKISIVD